jgi:hypothetical protein
MYECVLVCIWRQAKEAPCHIPLAVCNICRYKCIPGCTLILFVLIHTHILKSQKAIEREGVRHTYASQKGTVNGQMQLCIDTSIHAAYVHTHIHVHYSICLHMYAHADTYVTGQNDAMTACCSAQAHGVAHELSPRACNIAHVYVCMYVCVYVCIDMHISYKIGEMHGYLSESESVAHA